jgi:hypothetical protein
VTHSFIQALSERRLKLVLDSSGRCTHVLSGDESVFGFSPEDLVGHALGDFIDAFKVSTSGIDQCTGVRAGQALITGQIPQEHMMYKHTVQLHTEQN